MAQCDSIAINPAVMGFTITQGVLAGMILLMLTFTKKRVDLCPSVMNGVPGLVTPVNLLRITPHRIINAVAFASMSSSILANIYNPPSLGTVANEYGEVFIEFLTTWFFVLLQAILYFPLFGCLYASIRWLGMMMGAIYSAVTLVKVVIQFVEFSCLQPHTLPQVWLQLGMNLPTYICLLILAIYYIIGCIHEMWKCSKSLNVLQAAFSLVQPSSDETDYYKRWVKDMLSYKRPESSALLSIKYQPKVFKFSPKFISAIFIMLVLIYQLTLFWISILLILVAIFVNALNQINSLSNALPKIEKGLQAAAVVGPCITSIIVFCILIYMVKCIRSDLKNVIRGDFSSFHIPSSSYNDSSFNVPIPTPEAILASSLDYMSHQVAYLIISWTIFLFAVFGIGVTIAVIVLLFVFARSFILPKAFSFIMVLIIGRIIMPYIQNRMCTRVFKDSTFEIERKNNSKKTPPAKDTSIVHVRLYHWWTYVFFIFNTFHGLVSSLWRFIWSVITIVFHLMRMDRNMYIRGQESSDKGYATYIAVLYLEFTQNNPIANCFVQLLLEAYAAKSTADKPVRCNRMSHKENYDVILEAQPYKGYFRVSRKARNRWHLVYTLLRNPDLKGSRKPELKDSRETEPPNGTLKRLCACCLPVMLDVDVN